ncbi:MAG TPA: hypothetical protein VFT34_09890 [Verrucomicrobiae bacterium]|nr:hypothetical protein [Verrucomicrobiae bacterium]
MAQPPPLPPAGKNLRLARWLNLALPGAGLFYLGRRRLGAALAVPFLACFFAAFSLFLVSYGRYLSLTIGGDILEAGRLEKIGEVFPRVWLAGLAIAGVLIQLCSMALFERAKKQAAKGNNA